MWILWIVAKNISGPFLQESLVATSQGKQKIIKFVSKKIHFPKEQLGSAGYVVTPFPRSTSETSHVDPHCGLSWLSLHPSTHLRSREVDLTIYRSYVARTGVNGVNGTATPSTKTTVELLKI